LVPKLRVVGKQNTILQNPISLPIVQQVEPMTIQPKYITQEQFDNGLNSIVEKLAHKLEPDSALTPEVRGVVKAVGEIQSLRLALKDPTSAGIEEATSGLVTTVLANALSNITNTGQHVAPQKPLRNTLAEIVVHNLTGENSPLPQILDAFTNILGVDKVKEGYDVGMGYIQKQQSQNNLPNVILQLDENNQEHVVLYAEKMGYTDVQYAQTRLIEHKDKLYQEIEEYQKVQQGGKQNIVNEPIYQEPIDEPYIDEEIYEEQYTQNVDYNEEPIIEKPVMKANKVIILHNKPKKLVLAKDIIEEKTNKNIKQKTNKNIKEKTNNKDDELLDIDNIIKEIGDE